VHALQVRVEVLRRSAGHSCRRRITACDRGGHPLGVFAKNESTVSGVEDVWLCGLALSLVAIFSLRGFAWVRWKIVFGVGMSLSRFMKPCPAGEYSPEDSNGGIKVVLRRKRRRDPRASSDINWEGLDAFEFMERNHARAPNDPGTADEKRVRTQIGPFYTYNPLPLTQQKLLLMIHTQFTDEVLGELVAMIEDTKIPQRMLEWLVQNYAKEHPVVVMLDREDGTQEVVDVHDMYKNMRWAVRKRHFDFFCKRFRVAFDYKGRTYVTAVTQLNIFLFARRLKLREILEERYDEITEHYRSRIERRNERRRRGDLKRKELSHALLDRAILAVAPVKTRVTLKD
jgi:hypothetical protein